MTVIYRDFRKRRLRSPPQKAPAALILVAVAIWALVAGYLVAHAPATTAALSGRHTLTSALRRQIDASPCFHKCQ